MNLEWHKSSYSSPDGNCVEIASTWRKSSYSTDQGNCVEVADAWRKSTYSSAQGNCVETAPGGSGVVAVRDSKDPDGPVLRFGAAGWAAFTGEVRAGRYDIA